MNQIHRYTETSSGPSDRVELLVHGVGGTPPEAMLGTDRIDRVRGDDTAGFFRRKESSEDSGYVQEAYSWGGLTSRSSTRAWWVLLAPFAFVNVAGWMLPDARGQERRHAIAAALLRLTGFLITVHAIIWIGQMTVDFASWQCGASVSCRSSTWFMSVFNIDWFLGAPGRRIVLGMVGPLGALAVFRVLTSRSVDRYETVDPEALKDYGPESVAAGEEDSFADPTFWRRGTSIRSFASLHLAGSAAAVTWLVAWTLGWLQPTGTPWVQYVLGVGALGLFLVAVLGVSIGRRAAPSFDKSTEARLVRLVRWHWMATSLVVGGTLLAGIVWPGYEDPAKAGPLDPYGNLWTSLWVFSGLVLLAFIVVVLSNPSRSSTVTSPLGASAERGRLQVGFWSIGPIIAALFGFLVAAVMLLSFGAASARLFGGRPAIDYSYLYDVFAVLAAGWLVALVLALTVAWLTRQKASTETVEDDIVGDFREDLTSFATGPSRKRKWLISVRRMRDVRAFIPRAESILGVMVLAAAAIVVVAVFLEEYWGGASDWIEQHATDAWVTGLVWIMAVGVPIALMNAVRRAYGSRQARRTIGTLWDVVTFWPRWFHPLAPPSYCGRAIPELRTRLDYLVSNTDDGESSASVVATAHSQGSVVTMAALDGLRGQSWFDRVALLTHGSPITRLYVRYFPAHLIPSIKRVHDATGQDRWLNLYRLTDPIGGAISGELAIEPLGCWHPGVGAPLSTLSPDGWGSFTDPVADPDLRLFAEAGPDKMYPKKGDPYPAPLGHSEYAKAPEFERAVRRLLDLPY